MNIIGDIDSRTFTLSAIIIGYLLLDDSTPAEQNSLGNWFMLIGQVLCTNSAQQQVLNNRNKNQKDQPIINNNQTHDTNQERTTNKRPNDGEIQMIKKVIRAMQQEIDNLKK